GDVADRGAVHVHVAGLDHAADAGLAVVEVDDDAVLGDDDPVLGDPAEHGELGMGAQVTPFPVDRHEVPRPHHVEHVQQLSRGCVPGDVDQGVALVDDFGAPAGQAVDDPVDGVLVSGDERGSQDDRVPGFDVDLVVPVGHAAQGGHGLALGAGAHQDDFVGGQRLEVARVHEQVAGDFEVAELPGDVHVADHGAAHEGDFAAVGLGRVEDLLDPVDVGRKTGDDDALLGFREDRVEDAGDVAFAGDEAGDFRVGGVRHQQVDAFRAEPREPAEVGDAVVQRQLVHFEVAGVQHVAGRGAHTDRERIRDGVVDREELEVEGAEGVLFAFGDLDQGRFDAVFPEFGGEQGQGEAGAYQRDIGAFPQQEGDAANVVFVAVREHDRLDVVEAPPQV